MSNSDSLVPIACQGNGLGGVSVGGPRDARDRILAAADHVFQRLGSTRTTVSDISRAAGVSRPTVYRHFGDRQGVLSAIRHRRVHMLAEGARLSIAEYPDFDQTLVEGLLYLTSSGADELRLAGLTDVASSDVVLPPVLAADLLTGLAVTTWTPLLHAAVLRGEARSDLDVAESARWLAWLQLALAGAQPWSWSDSATLRRMLRAFVVPLFIASDQGS